MRRTVSDIALDCTRHPGREQYVSSMPSIGCSRISIVALLRQPVNWLNEMAESRTSKFQFAVLLIGDILTIALVTLFGFATHDELGTAGRRMLTTFIPLVVAWGMVAPFLGVYDLQKAAQARQLWRPFWAGVIMAPMAGWLRKVWLDQLILPVFVFVLGGVSSLAILAWRAIYWAIFFRSRASHG